MTLSESVATLSTLLPALKANDAKFASDLIASFKKYGGLTSKQEPWIGKLIARASVPVSAPAPVVNVGGFAGVVALFNKAKESGLKFPKIRLMLNGTMLILSVNGPKSKGPGFVSISGEGVYPNRPYFGRVSPAGEFTPFKGGLAGLTDLLSELASNPARVAKDHGKLTGNCCFCNKEVGKGKEKRSVLAGFGPDCAENYGLKAEWLAAVEKAEAKASVALPANIPTAADVPSFAESLAKATGAVSVTVTDEAKGLMAEWPAPAHNGMVEPVNTDELQAELGPDYGVPVTAEPVDTKECFFCETPSTSTKTLHGFTVCAACVDQLK